MKALLRQFASLIGAGIAAACCLGVSAVLSAVGAVGLGFLVHDAYLFPLFVAFVGVSVWILYRSTAKRQRLGPFWLGLAGGGIAAASLWLLVTGIYPIVWSLYAGLGALIAGSVWDFVNAVNARRSAACPATESVKARAPVLAKASIEDPKALDSRSAADNARVRLAKGAALAAAAAGVFYGLYKSVDRFGQKAEAGAIACYGINTCRGRSACSTAQNACTGQNACKGRGWVNATPQQCAAQGGVPLAGSPADPDRG
ncbi:MAG: MerC domain-containing protein [Proteobacteria bacterium]|nr:MerC domain-containing protein [Pseudomonadota bacterium]